MGLVRERVERLFTLGRPQEAIAAASQASHEDVLAIAALLVAHDEDAAAERLVREQATGTRNFRLLDWLCDQISRRGDLSAALAVAREVFEPEPSLARYRRAHELATALERWEAMRPELIAVLQPVKYRDVWIQVALDEGDIDQALTLALASLQAVTAYPSSWAVAATGSSYVLTVAQAAEATHPDGARAIYERMAERAIERKNRGAYQEACGYLTHVRDLYDRVNHHDIWLTYRDGLRAQYPKLRALKEEMASAGLLD